MDRHVYAWNRRRRSGRRASRSWSSTGKVAVGRSRHPRDHLQRRRRRSLQQGAIIDTPRSATSTGDAAPRDRRRHQRGVRRTTAPRAAGPWRRRLLARSQCPRARRPARLRQRARLRDQGRRRPRRPGRRPSAVRRRAGRGRRDRADRAPAVVGEGITGSPVIAAGRLRRPAARRRRSASIPAAGRLHRQRRRHLLLRRGRTAGRRRCRRRGLRQARADRPPGDPGGRPPGVRRARRHRSPRSCAPAAGVIRALDLAFIEYQRRPGLHRRLEHVDRPVAAPVFPGAVNDLSFLTGPAVADIDGDAGEEVVAGTASQDLVASSAGGHADVDAVAEADHRLDHRRRR